MMQAEKYFYVFQNWYT